MRANHALLLYIIGAIGVFVLEGLTGGGFTLWFWLSICYLLTGAYVILLGAVRGWLK